MISGIVGGLTAAPFDVMYVWHPPLSIGVTDGSGGLVINVPIPSNPSLAGAVMTVQEFIAALGGPLLGAGELSNGARMTFGF